ncbi:MAG: SDR family oxidoreductase [Planctomycetaceae bacterium]|nr:MAG: SDR family oxidoreductase [Planctomycetaceae bacterium]
MELNLQGHVAVVTCGGSGIGLAIARQFAREGCSVALWDVNPAVSETAADLAAEFEATAIGLPVDLTDFAQVRKVAGETASRSGPVDHVVHAAAIGSGKFGFPFTNLEPADWRRPLDVNIMGMVHVAHAVVPAMIPRRTGTLVFLASVAGQIGSQTDPPYSAAKAANINFAQCLAKDLAGHGIRVNTVCPGMVQTPLNRSVWQAWNDLQPDERKRSYEDWAGEKVKNVVPLGRWQQPEDIADMAVFLSSDRARQVTGQTINVDGGFVMHW